jgi:DNA polymerase-3 subunit alpha
MNQTGLNNIFKLISESYTGEYFYRKPRIDYSLLKKHNEGIIALSACLGGVYAGCFWTKREEGREAILECMREVTQEMVSIFGDRWYGEIQWNNIPEQHELNQYVIEVCKEFDVKVVSTVDSHYPNPDAWRDRELYKRLGWLGKGKPEWLEMTLPTSAEEIGYELYPKNGDQVWNSYKEYSKLNKVTYDDEFVMGTLEETHDIAFNRIEKFYPDDTVRLPDFVVPAGYTEDEYLKRLTFKGLADAPNKVHKDQRYVARLEHELKVIADRGFSKYFLTMKAITDKTNEIQLSGPGRGSAAGSLVAYCLGITQVDPIHYGLLFSRFLTQGERIGVWDEQNGTLTSGNFVELISDTGEKLILDPRLSVRVMRGTQTMEVEVKNLQENDTLLA